MAKTTKRRSPIEELRRDVKELLRRDVYKAVDQMERHVKAVREQFAQQTRVIQDLVESVEVDRAPARLQDVTLLLKLITKLTSENDNG